MIEQDKKRGTVILGMGNPILADDGVGIRIAQKIKEKNPGLEVIETSEAGLALLEYVAGYDRLIIIDSIKTGEGKLGELFKLGLEELGETQHFASLHGVNLNTALELGKRMGFKVPECISIYAVEVKNNSTFAEGCTEEVEAKVPLIAEQIIKEENL